MRGRKHDLCVGTAKCGVDVEEYAIGLVAAPG